MNELHSLASLITLANMQDMIDEIKIQFGNYGPPEENNEYVEEWIAYAFLLPPEYCFGKSTNSLEKASLSLLAVLEDRNFHLPEVIIENAIPQPEKVKTLITNLLQLLTKLNSDWSLTLAYRPKFEPETLICQATFMASLKGSGSVIRTYGVTFHDVCIKLWEKIQNAKNDLPEIF